jgi:hypothetical protein
MRQEAMRDGVVGRRCSSRDGPPPETLPEARMVLVDSQGGGGGALRADFFMHLPGILHWLGHHRNFLGPFSKVCQKFTVSDNCGRRAERA